MSAKADNRISKGPDFNPGPQDRYMQKYDWLRLFKELRPTFLPYARFTLQTHLSPEQCQEMLASVTQPQKMPALLSTPTSLDSRLVFKGQISKTGFFIVPVDRHGLSKLQGPQPFWLFGRIKHTFGGAEVSVNVFLDPWCYLVMFSLLGIVLVQTLEVRLSSGLYADAGKLFFIPVLMLRSLLVYLAIALPASCKAFQVKQTLKTLLP